MPSVFIRDGYTLTGTIPAKGQAPASRSSTGRPWPRNCKTSCTTPGALARRRPRRPSSWWRNMPCPGTCWAKRGACAGDGGQPARHMAAPAGRNGRSRLRLHDPGAGGRGKKLAATVRLILFHPEVANRSCSDCRKWIYREDGERLTRGPERIPVPRAPGAPTPCASCPKIPMDSPAKDAAHAISPSDRSLQAYRHYLECEAVGHFPDDPIVCRNAGIIRAIRQQWERWPALQLLAVLGAKVK